MATVRAGQRSDFRKGKTKNVTRTAECTPKRGQSAFGSRTTIIKRHQRENDAHRDEERGKISKRGGTIIGGLRRRPKRRS